ncbi:MAG: hypothetical protein AB7I37_06445 [Pirellulales bacterium]
MKTHERKATIRMLRNFIKYHTRKGGKLTAESKVYKHEGVHNGERIHEELYYQNVGEFLADIRRLVKTNGNDALWFIRDDGWHDQTINAQVGCDDHGDNSLFIEIHPEYHDPELE